MSHKFPAVSRTRKGKNAQHFSFYVLTPRTGGGKMALSKYPCANSKKRWIDYLMCWEGLCSKDEVRALEMGRWSWIIQWARCNLNGPSSENGREQGQTREGSVLTRAGRHRVAGAAGAAFGSGKGRKQLPSGVFAVPDLWPVEVSAKTSVILSHYVCSNVLQ